MVYKLFLASRRRLAPSIVLCSSPFLIYGLQSQPVLRNDNVGNRPWPERHYEASRKVRELESSAPTEKSSQSRNSTVESWFGDNELSWSSFSTRFSDAGSSLSSFQWSSIGDRIADLIIPDWALTIPAYVRKLQLELAMEPGSLVDEIRQEAEDPTINPEIQWTAQVRIARSLCPEEVSFQKYRRDYTRRALAKYLDIPENDVHPEDVPTIAMCGSGGGLRALVAGCSSYMCAQQDGLFDCVTYTAGVSGSCWLQFLFNSSLAGGNYEKLLGHLKRRVDTHFAFPPAALNLLTTAPTNKFLLSGLIEKAKADPKANFGLVDIYGLLLAARLLIPRGELEVDAHDLKLSNQRAGVDFGANPLPIYTAVRHEIPLEVPPTNLLEDGDHPSEEKKETAKQESWFQWFEWTPYEFWCEEAEAGIPTWSLGRQFRHGSSVPLENGFNLPEMRVPQLLGIWGSAFCATLSHYYMEIRPLIRGIAGFGGLDNLIEERNDDLAKVHPIEPATIPNFILGLEDKLPPTTPRSMIASSDLQLMDAGMSNNLPVYPLLRPGRDVDIIVAFDASADIKNGNWLSVADGYAKQRGIKGWPIGAGWPSESASKAETARELDVAQASTAQEVTSKAAAARQGQEMDLANMNTAEAEANHIDPNQQDLGHCTVWIGATQERSASSDSPPSKRFNADADWELLSPEHSGIAVIYFPLIPNPKVPGVDPETSPFMSTWNSVYTPEDIDDVAALARSNYQEGREQTRRCVRAIYERKRRLRIDRESEETSERWRRRLKGNADQFRS